MASPNFTGNEKETKFEYQYCSDADDLADGILQESTNFAVIVNVFLAITAFLGNTLIVVALHKETSLHQPSKILLRCLATTDLCVGLISEPVAVLYWMSLMNKNWDICRHAFVALVITSYILCGMSLLTMTAISVDRLLALSMGLKYRQVVTVRHTYITVIIFWVISIVCSTMYVKDNQVAVRYTHFVTALCLIISSVSYTKIFLKLRERQNQVQEVENEQPSYSGQINVARYRKAVSSALWLQLTLVACYLPNGIATLLSTESKLSSWHVLANRIAITLVFLNSSLNPILYCWKMREVRQAVKSTVAKLWCPSV